jgi:hypothetical protein
VGGRGWDDDAKFFFLNNLVAYRNIQLRYDDADTTIWITEFGYTTWQDIGGTPPEEWMNYLTPEQKANYIYRAFEVAQSLDYVGPTILWNLNFANQTTLANRQEIAGFSLAISDENGNLSPRESFNNLISRFSREAVGLPWARLRPKPIE